MQKEVKQAPVTLKVPGRLGVSKRKNDILEESLGEIRSDEEDSSSDEDYANFDSCDTKGNEDDENNDGFGDDINSSQIDPRATENKGND